jgi:hypothetical protein
MSPRRFVCGDPDTHLTRSVGYSQSVSVEKVQLNDRIRCGFTIGSRCRHGKGTGEGLLRKSHTSILPKGCSRHVNESIRGAPAVYVVAFDSPSCLGKDGHGSNSIGRTTAQSTTLPSQAIPRTPSGCMRIVHHFGSGFIRSNQDSIGHTRRASCLPSSMPPTKYWSVTSTSRPRMRPDGRGPCARRLALTIVHTTTVLSSCPP